MTVERVTIQQVQEELTEFMAMKVSESEDYDEFPSDKVTQQIVDEINKDIEADGQSFVPKCMFGVLADEELVSEELEDEFVAWYEEKHA